MSDIQLPPDDVIRGMAEDDFYLVYPSDQENTVSTRKVHVPFDFHKLPLNAIKQKIMLIIMKSGIPMAVMFGDYGLFILDKDKFGAGFIYENALPTYILELE